MFANVSAAPFHAEALKAVEQIPIGGRQIHDANIVATMLAHGIPRLLTNNPGDFQRFAAHITVIPLAAVP